MAGPDGNLWFTERTGARIGRITPAGAVTEFSTGITPSSFRTGIAAGPDGNLWFTEEFGDRIGRITPAGDVTEFSTGITAGSRPNGIVAGPDGNLWFTEENGHRIGRITPAGVVSEFSAGITPGSDPFGIAAGPDGALWFAEFVGTRIGRVALAPAGVGFDPVSVAFGEVEIDAASATQTVTVSSTGDLPLAIDRVRVAGADAGDFVIVGDTCTDAVLASAATCVVRLRFLPTTGGVRSAVLEVRSDASSSPDTVVLSGIGAPVDCTIVGTSASETLTGTAGR